jgi:hypothetical protein
MSHAVLSVFFGFPPTGFVGHIVLSTANDEREKTPVETNLTGRKPFASNRLVAVCIMAEK